MAATCEFDYYFRSANLLSSTAPKNSEFSYLREHWQFKLQLSHSLEKFLQQSDES